MNNDTQFLGFTTLSTAIRGTIVTEDGSRIPTNATALPQYRVYGPAGTLMTNGTGALSFKDTATNITGATNANPIVITTSAAHGLATGNRVTITGVVGNTAANTTANITVLTSTTYSLDSVAGNGAYTSGGTWNLSGVYDLSITPTAGNGYAVGSFYQVLITYVVSSVTKTATCVFGVV